MDIVSLVHKSKKLIKDTKKNLENLKEKWHVFQMPELSGDKEITHNVYISPISAVKSAIWVILVLLALVFIYKISDILILFFFALFFSATLDPWIDFLERLKLPRWLGVIMLYIMIIAVFLLLFGSLIPIIIDQITTIIQNIWMGLIWFIKKIEVWEVIIPYVWSNINSWLVNALKWVNINLIVQSILNNFSGLATELKTLATWWLVAVWWAVWAWASFASAVWSFLMNLILVLFLTFFMVTDKDNLDSFFRSLFPPENSKYIQTKLSDIQSRIWSWVRWQIALMSIMFVVSIIWLIIIWMWEYALTLAIIMGIWEFLPYIWPVIFLIVSLPIALNISIFTVFKLLILYSIMQFFEWNIFVPLVMKKAVWLSPIVILLVILIWFKFLWIIWAIIAVPLTTAISIFIQDYIYFQASKKNKLS